MNRPIYLGFAILEFNKSSMYETYYDKLQPYFDRENLHSHYMDCDSFVLSIRSQVIIKVLKKFAIYLTSKIWT